MQQVIDEVGPTIQLSSVNKEEWKLGMLRSGEGDHRRAAWLDYDAGGAHGHADALTLGLFAHGLDLLPDLGYPPVQFGGWGAPRATWYKKTASHNTVTIDRQNQPSGEGETTLWVDEGPVRAIRAKVPAANNGQRYERTIVQVDVSEDLFYIVDVFRVEGGKEHTKFVQGHFGSIDVDGLDMRPGEDFGHDAQLRNIEVDEKAKPGWNAVWNVDDRYKLLPEGLTVGMQYYDFTNDATAGRAEAWVVEGSYNSMIEAWVPRLMIQRKAEGDEPLKSTFVSVYVPYAGEAPEWSVERFSFRPGVGKDISDTDVAINITFQDGNKDVIILQDQDKITTDHKSLKFYRKNAENENLSAIRR